MKHKLRFLAIFTLLLAFLLAFSSPAAASAGGDGDDGGEVVFGGSYTLKSGQTLNGDLAIFGGQGKIEKDARVEGNILIVGGIMEISGVVKGEVVAIGATVKLLDSAVIEKDINVIGTLEKSDKATVKGNTVIGPEQGFKLDNFSDFNFGTPEKPAQPSTPRVPEALPGVESSAAKLWGVLGTVGKFFGDLLAWFALAGLAALVALFLPKPTEMVAKTITNAPILSGGMGLLTMLIAPALIILLVITIILSPIGLLAFMVLAIALLFGWVAIGMEIGNRLSTSFKVSWAPAVSAALGTLLLSVVTGLINYIACVGWMAGFIFLAIGLGGVVLSKFGTRTYISTTSHTQTSVVPPAMPHSPPIDPQPSFMQHIETDEPADTTTEAPKAEKRKQRPAKTDETPDAAG
ncbi:MAG: polymer-forming cytoskeletal protein [Anaerolineae bacterium]|nr:polymer-forming cytoskeletal protein [Anaerolineae bacterium]